MQYSHLINAVARSNGHYSSKFNRVRKLIDMWGYLEDKMIHIIERGHGISEQARCAYGVLLIMQTGIRVGNESSSEGYVSVKTEFVKIPITPADREKAAIKGKHLKGTHKMVPVREYNEDGEYVLKPQYAHLPRYIRIDKEWISTDDYDYPEIQTFGLTTLKTQHIKIGRNNLRIQFIGKKGVHQDLSINHPTLVKYAAMPPCQNSDNPTWLCIDYPTLWYFIKKYIGKQFKPKDLRTAVINIKYINQLQQSFHSVKLINKKKDSNAYIKNLITQVAEQIGHTPSVCKSAYLSPKLIAFTKDMMAEIIAKNKENKK
jgi:hypothetical protein